MLPGRALFGMNPRRRVAFLSFSKSVLLFFSVSLKIQYLMCTPLIFSERRASCGVARWERRWRGVRVEGGRRRERLEPIFD